MAQETINLGSEPCGAGGDSIRGAFGKCNSNFSELYESVDGALVSISDLQSTTVALEAAVDLKLDAAGRSDGNPVPDGQIGEFQFQSLSVGSAISLTSTLAGDVITLPLYAGDWEIWGVVIFSANDTTGKTGVRAGISTTSSFLPASSFADTFMNYAWSDTVQRISTPRLRVNVATPDTYHLLAAATFGSGSVTAYGTIRARRMS